MRDESELIGAAARGDPAAFDELVRAKRERVVRVAMQITGDRDDALDVAQTVFLKLWGGLGRYDPGQRFDTWLYRVTVNAAIDWLRSRGPRGVLQPLPDQEEEPAGERPEPERAIDLGRLQRAFYQLAARLAPKQRAAFVLKEIEGLPTLEVAEILGVTESTVRNHLLSARRALRQGLETNYPGLVPRRPLSRRAAGEGAPGGDDPEEVS